MSDTLAAMSIREIKTLQASTWDRLSRIGYFERQLAEGADADYPAVCHELLGFCREALNGYLALCRSTLVLAEAMAEREQIDRQIEAVITEAADVHVALAALAARASQGSPGDAAGGS